MYELRYKGFIGFLTKDSVQFIILTPPNGKLMVFPGGRYYHRRTIMDIIERNDE